MRFTVQRMMAVVAVAALYLAVFHLSYEAGIVVRSVNGHQQRKHHHAI